MRGEIGENEWLLSKERRNVKGKRGRKRKKECEGRNLLMEGEGRIRMRNVIGEREEFNGKNE